MAFKKKKRQEHVGDSTKIGDENKPKKEGRGK
jgi:hypothetical protein